MSLYFRPSVSLHNCQFTIILLHLHKTWTLVCIAARAFSGALRPPQRNFL
jgi:hypothetical protein